MHMIFFFFQAEDGIRDADVTGVQTCALPISEHRLRLASAGIDVETAEKSGQFQLRNWADAYLRDGHFDQDRMLALIQEVLDGGSQQGFALTRLVAHMEWALEDRPGVDDLVEYE